MTESAITGSSAAEIADSVRGLIARGELRPDDMLPPVRALAAQLGLNRNTVAAAYASLAGAGIVETRSRAGTAVRGIASVASEGASAPSGAVNLADGNPDPALLPALPDLQGYSTVLYGAAGIEDPLLRWAQDHLLPDAPGGTFVLTHGAVDAIERVLNAHLMRGDAVAVEDPCFLSSIDTYRLNGYRVLPVPLDEHGMTPQGLREALAAGARAVVITPRAHNPTGATLSSQRAEELRTILTTRPDVLVIEDDHFSALSGATYARATPEGTHRWALVRSVSKFLGPDLRIGLTACDPDTAARLQAHLAAATWVSHVLQHLVTRLLTDPEVTRQLDQAGQTYRHRRLLLTDALRGHGVDYFEGPEGLNVWIPLALASEEAVVEDLVEHGWAVRGGEVFTVGAASAIRVTTSTLTPDQAEAFAARLATTLSSIS